MATKVHIFSPRQEVSAEDYAVLRKVSGREIPYRKFPWSTLDQSIKALLLENHFSYSPIWILLDKGNKGATLYGRGNMNAQIYRLAHWDDGHQS